MIVQRIFEMRVAHDVSVGAITKGGEMAEVAARAHGQKRGIPAQGEAGGADAGAVDMWGKFGLGEREIQSGAQIRGLRPWGIGASI